jgi:hypothetical protein
MNDAASLQILERKQKLNDKADYSGLALEREFQ